MGISHKSAEQRFFERVLPEPNYRQCRECTMEKDRVGARRRYAVLGTKGSEDGRGPRVKRNTLLRKKIFERDGGVCAKCNRFDAKWECDHILALWSGGKDAVDNCQTLCRRCHLAKSVGETPVRAKTDRLRERHQLTQKRKPQTSARGGE